MAAVFGVMAIFANEKLCYAGSGVDSSSFDWLPKGRYSSQFDIFGEYICVVPIKDDDKLAILYNRYGDTVFTVSDTGHGRFWLVAADPDLLLLARAQAECSGYFDVYDYSGRKQVRLDKIEGLLGHSPSGAYYHTNFDPVLCSVVPILYDKNGLEIARFRYGRNGWNLTAVNDSIIIYKESNILSWYHVPRGIVIREHAMESVPLFYMGAHSSINRDGVVYAYDNSESVVIYRDSTKQTIVIDKDEIGQVHNMWSSFWLDESGNFLICQYGLGSETLICVLQYTGEEYRKIIDNYAIPRLQYMGHVFRNPSFHDSLCAINFCGRSETGLRLCSFIFSFLTPDHITYGVSLNGGISYLDSLGCMLVTTNDPDSGRCTFREIPYDSLFSRD
jgi:hypothetical protein